MSRPTPFLIAAVLLFPLLLPAQDRSEINGSLTVGFKAIDNRGDPNFFRERVGERAGLTLESARAEGISPHFRRFRLDSLFTAENNGRALFEFGAIDKFRLRFQFDRWQTYSDTSSTNFAAASLSFSPTPARLFSLPGDLTLRRTVVSAEWSWRIRQRLLLRGGWRFRRSNGSDLRLAGGSFFSVLDASLPTTRNLSTSHHTYFLGGDFSLGRVNFHLGGEVQNLRSRDSFLQPQVGGIALDRELTQRNDTHGHSASATASFDFVAGESWHVSGGYLFTDLRNNPQWSRLEASRYFGTHTRRGDRLHADAQYHGLFAQALYAPRRALAVRYRVVQEWGAGAGQGWQLRFENPVDQSLTESLQSRTSSDTSLHRQQVSISLYPFPRTTLKVSYQFDGRTRTYRDFFTPVGLDFVAGARVQEGEQKADVHRLSFDARLRAGKDVELRAGYGRRQSNIREMFHQLVRAYFLGDRDTDSNLYWAGVKVRTPPGASIAFEFRREKRKYGVTTALPQLSSNRLDQDTISASINLHPTSRWFLFGVLHYTTADTRLLGLARTAVLLTFSPWEYTASNTGFLAGSRWVVQDRFTIGAQFQQNRAGGTENYLLRDVGGSVQYELASRWSLGARYQFFESKLVRVPLNNYHANVAQGLLNYRF